MLVIAEILVHRGTDVLLVKQQKSEDPEPYWTLPGGLVESDELATETATRETLEESGLTIRSIGHFLYVSQSQSFRRAEQIVVFCFESSDWSGEIVCEDPDRVVTEARFFSTSAAIGALESSPRPETRGLRMTEPLVSYLNGSVEKGTVWFCRERPDGTHEMIGHLPNEG